MKKMPKALQTHTMAVLTESINDKNRCAQTCSWSHENPPKKTTINEIIKNSINITLNIDINNKIDLHLHINIDIDFKVSIKINIKIIININIIQVSSTAVSASVSGKY